MSEKKLVIDYGLPVVLAGLGTLGGYLSRPVVNVPPPVVNITKPVPPLVEEMPEEPVMHEHKIVRDAGEGALEEVTEHTLNNRWGY